MGGKPALQLSVAGQCGLSSSTVVPVQPHWAPGDCGISRVQWADFAAWPPSFSLHGLLVGKNNILTISHLLPKARKGVLIAPQGLKGECKDLDLLTQWDLFI